MNGMKISSNKLLTELEKTSTAVKMNCKFISTHLPSTYLMIDVNVVMLTKAILAKRAQKYSFAIYFG